MDKIRQNIVLAGLLHDIGKFWQRAEPEAALLKSQFLKEDTKNIIGDFCPKKYQGYSHIHSAWTYQFLVDYEKWLFQNLIDANHSVINLASSHHNPSTLIEEIIQKSDWISAGMDRSDTKDSQDDSYAEGKRSYNFRKQRLKPIFESLFSKDYHQSKSEKSVLRYILKPLALNQGCIFPSEKSGENISLDQEYRENLWRGFESEFQLLPNLNFNEFIESLLPLLQKYTWCIPSSTIDLPDISLYDHLRSTAAVALCYYDYIKEKYPDDLAQNNRSIVRKIFDCKNKPDQIALIICGDISGIQDFIYQIASHQAAKSLKGRSFMIQLLCDACARFFLTELDLPITNLVYSSGGNFYILAPNTTEVQQKLPSVCSRINQSLLSHYGGSLYLGTGQISLSAQDFLHNLGKKWQDAIHNSSKSKSRRFIDEIKSNPDFFKPFGQVADAKVCSICGKDCLENQLIRDKDGNDEKSICNGCNELIKLGNQLKKSQYLAEIFADTGRFKPMPGVPVTYDVFTDKDIPAKLAYYHDVHVCLYRFNNTDFIPDNMHSSQSLSYSFKFYGGNHFPIRDDGEMATFNDLAEEGIKRLGVLRMDVDNLGTLFKRGFNYSSATTDEAEEAVLYSLSRLSTLSSMLDLFFSGYLNKISLNPEYNDKLFIIYSGGDDIFIVGKWNYLVDCASDIRAQFRKFCCNHPDITLSGGMVLVGQKHPIHRSAEMAGEAEHLAKENQVKISNENIHKKDAFTFLDKTLSWNDFAIAEMMKTDLLNIIEDSESRNKGLLVRLRRIYENYQKEKGLLEKQTELSPEMRQELVQYNKWRWRMVYDLSRFMKGDKAQNELVEEFQQALLKGNQYKDRKTWLKIPDFIDLPTRWTEFLIR